LLKEAAMEFFAKHAESVMSSSGWEKITESASILKELMEVLVASNKKRQALDIADEERDYKHMRVSTLRRMLEEKGLDVDGSREMLIKRLEEGEMMTVPATHPMKNSFEIHLRLWESIR
jgi:hypothetical protein